MSCSTHRAVLNCHHFQPFSLPIRDRLFLRSTLSCLQSALAFPCCTFHRHLSSDIDHPSYSILVVSRHSKNQFQIGRIRIHALFAHATKHHWYASFLSLLHTLHSPLHIHRNASPIYKHHDHVHYCMWYNDHLLVQNDPLVCPSDCSVDETSLGL